MKHLNGPNLLLIVLGLALLFVAHKWQYEDTSLDIVLAFLGGLFVGGALVLSQRQAGHKH